MPAEVIQALSMRLRGLARLPGIARYGLTALLILAVFGVIMVNPDLFSRATFLLFFPVIFIVAVVFDHGSSIFATLMAAAASAIVLTGSRGSLALQTADLLMLALFVLVGLIIGSIVEAMRHALDELSNANAALLHAGEDAKSQAALLTSFIEGASDPIFVKDRDGRHIHANSACAAIFGITAGEMLGRRDVDLLGPDEASAVVAIDQRVMRENAPLTVEEVATGHDGVQRTYLSTKSPWRGADGGVRGVIGVARDIDERKAAEHALAEADAQKQLLLFDINHRIKNHLQTIVGPMSMAARRAGTLEAARDALNDAASRLTVLGRVYTQLQLSAGHSVVDSGSFIKELCTDLWDSLSQRNVLIHCEAQSETIESSRAVTLGLIVNELVQNAFKYAFPEGRAGAVRVAFGRDGDDYVLSVADNGVGTPPDAPARGTGTGQRLIHAMAAQLGGSLDRGGPPGTVWTLRFPAVR